MKTVCIIDSVSRVNGGIFEAERRLQQNLHSQMGIDVQVVGLRDSHTDSDLGAWSPLLPITLPVKGPRAFGFAPGFTSALTKTGADLGYLAGLWKFPSVAALRWSSRSGKPLMVAPHGMLDRWALQNSGFKKKIAGWFFQDEQLRRAACLRALCRTEAASIRDYGLKNPICVIPNGIDPPPPAIAGDEALRDALFPPGRRVLLYLGRLHPKKGLAHLLTAWSGTRSPGRDWILAIAGWNQGGHEAELKRQATELGIDWADNACGDRGAASIHFLGPRFGGDKEACYRFCDAFILPSLSEGLPMVVLEAWAYAKPVLMTAECNLPEGFAADAALRLEPTAESLSEGLRRLFAMSGEELQAMGRRGCTLVENRFAWRKLAVEMASVYEWMLGGGPKPACVENG
ncbi:MAG TPA: glycosyltransferase [Candidatus Methylacidiphilales bacterium]|jgi:poly(glycerol-phosphate) alpha-glucosyltransferase|nr:glycosyltransferase [Candidatus Methylacidiphilales bacterium]